jgi:hypothetical protein
MGHDRSGKPEYGGGWPVTGKMQARKSAGRNGPGLAYASWMVRSLMVTGMASSWARTSGGNSVAMSVMA